MNVPEELLRNPHFARYYRTWQKNEASIVFVPLAQICREKGLLNEAREICERGLQRHPDSVSGRLMLARIYFDQDDSDESRRIVERVLEEFPGQQEALTLLARIRRTQRLPMGGIGVENRDSPPDSSPESGFAGSGRTDDEITEIEAAPLWENLTMAKIYADQGETKIARQMVDRILARNPNDTRAQTLKKELDR